MGIALALSDLAHRRRTTRVRQLAAFLRLARLAPGEAPPAPETLRMVPASQESPRP